MHCSHGQLLEVRRGALFALTQVTEDIRAQLAENLRERTGQLAPEEQSAYERNISQIGIETYNELIRDNLHGALAEIGLKAGGRSLDIGGGSGWLAVEMAKAGYFAVSLDLQDPWEREEQVAAGDAVRGFQLVTDLNPDLDDVPVDYVVGDMHRMPFADEIFDVVTMSAALHHAEDPVRTLAEASRVLKPDGVLLLINEPVKGVFRDEAPILGGRGEGAGEHIYWAGDYKRLFRKAGLRPRFLFPGWVDNRLRQRRFDGVVYYPMVRRLAALAWSAPPIRATIRGPLFRPLQDLFGLTLIAAARKDR